MSVIATRYGKFRIIDSDNVISHSLKEYGEWAQQEIDFLLHFIKAGDSVADVGAFIGTHSRAFSDTVGINGVVYAFEPRGKIVEVLLDNVKLSPIQNIKLFQCGLGDECREIEITEALEYSEKNFGNFSLNTIKKAVEGTQRIHLRTLDEFSIAHLDLIKVDVEGMEIDVLLGGDATILKNRPFIFAEVNSLRGGVPLINWCASHQYFMFCALHPAYNPHNFFKNSVNHFSNAVEVGALLIPKEKMAGYAEWISSQRLFSINNPDDLALVLLHKPQYFDEVLVSSESASILKADLLQTDKQADSGYINIFQRLAATEHARDRAEQLAIERLAELDNLHQRLATAEYARDRAEQLALERLAKLETIQASALWRFTEKLGSIFGVTHKIYKK